jgi:hypothetical protein
LAGGYFVGFAEDGFPDFQSRFDKCVETYKSREYGERQLERIRATPGLGYATYDLKNVPANKTRLTMAGR